MYCFATVCHITLVTSALAVFSGSPVFAQEAVPPLAAASIETLAHRLPLASPKPGEVVTSPGRVVDGRPRRPNALVPLYASYASLQVLDVHSTIRAVDRGAVEANPLMKGIVGSPAGMLAIKAAATTGVIYAGERLWKRNKTAAVLFMIGANSAMAWVVQHNYRAVR